MLIASASILAVSQILGFEAQTPCFTSNCTPEIGLCNGNSGTVECGDPVPPFRECAINVPFGGFNACARALTVRSFGISCGTIQNLTVTSALFSPIAVARSNSASTYWRYLESTIPEKRFQNCYSIFSLPVAAQLVPNNEIGGVASAPGNLNSGLVSRILPDAEACAAYHGPLCFTSRTVSGIEQSTDNFFSGGVLRCRLDASHIRIGYYIAKADYILEPTGQGSSAMEWTTKKQISMRFETTPQSSSCAPVFPVHIVVVQSRLGSSTKTAWMRVASSGVSASGIAGSGVQDSISTTGPTPVPVSPGSDGFEITAEVQLFQSVDGITGSTTVTREEVTRSAQLGDLNDDGNVDSRDLAILASHLASQTDLLAPFADINGDAVSDITDLSALLAFADNSECISDVAANATDASRNPNGLVGPEDLDAFISGFIAGTVAIADIASDNLDTTYNPNATVGPEDLDAFINGFMSGC